MGKPKEEWVAHWPVTSYSEPGVEYDVKVSKTGKWFCPCLAYRFTKLGPDGLKEHCKHIKKVRLSQEIATATGLPMVGQLKPGQKTLKEQKGKVVVQTSSVMVIQTRREICMEED